MAAMTSALCWLPSDRASQPTACDLIGSLYALQFLIHSAVVLVWLHGDFPLMCMRGLGISGTSSTPSSRCVQPASASSTSSTNRQHSA